MAEIIRLRGERQRAWRLPDGKIQAEIHCAPVCYQDDASEWQPVDLAFQEEDAPDGLGFARWLVVKKNKVWVGFRVDGKLQKFAGMRFGPGEWFHISLFGIERNGVPHVLPETADVPTKIVEGRVRQRIATGVHAEHWLSSASLRSHIRFATPPSDVKIAYDFEGEGLSVENERDGDNYYIPNADGEFAFLRSGDSVAFRLRRPQMYVEETEPDDNPQGGIDGVDHTLRLINGNLRYIKSANDTGRAWLAEQTASVFVDADTIYADTSDGYLTKDDAVWATAHDAASAENGNNAVTSSRATRTREDDEKYDITRGFFRFDTSGIDDGATVTAATLSLYVSALENEGSSTCVQGSTWGGTLELADFNTFIGSLFGEIASASAAQYNDLDFNEAGRAAIDLEGDTDLCVREKDHDYDDSAPAENDEYGISIRWADYADTGSDPKLVVTYTVGPIEQAVAGALTSAGAISRKTGKPVAGTLTSAGALVGKASKAVAGALTSAGALTRKTATVLTGTLTSTGAITKGLYVAVAGTLTSAGALARKTATSVAGTLTSAGTLVSKGLKALAGTLTSAGAVARKTATSLAGALTSTGAITKGLYVAVAGTLTSAGALARKAATSLAGTLTSAGIIVPKALKAVAGTLTSAGSVVKQTSISLAGVLTSVGTAVKQWLSRFRIFDVPVEDRTYTVPEEDRTYTVEGE